MSQYGAAWDAHAAAAAAAQHQHAAHAYAAAQHQQAAYGYGHAAAAHDYSAAGQLQLPQLHAPASIGYGSADPGSGARAPMNGRPGDWTCPKCQGLVFASRSECFKCGEPKPQSAQWSGAQPPAPTPMMRDGKAWNGRPGDWMCPSCYNNNFASRHSCFRCSAPKPGQPVHPDGGASASGPAADGRAFNARPGDWMCPSCNNNNFASRTACFRCSTPKPDLGLAQGNWNAGGAGSAYVNRPGDWVCPSCQSNVFGTRSACYRCSTPRPANAYPVVDAMARAQGQAGPAPAPRAPADAVRAGGPGAVGRKRSPSPSSPPSRSRSRLDAGREDGEVVASTDAPPPPAAADDDNVCLPHLLYGAAAGACVGADCPRRHLTLEAAEARALRIGRRQLASAVSLADADRLIRLFDAYGRQMDADNLGGVWSCLARQLRPMGGIQAAWVSAHEEAIARLSARTLELLPECDVHALASIVDGAAQARHSTAAALLDSVATIAVPCVAHFPPRALTATAAAYATAGRAAPALFDAIGRAAEPRIANFSAAELASLAWAYATAAHAAPALFDAIEHAAAATLGEFSADELSHTAWAFAALGVAAPALFAAVSHAAHRALPQCAADALANLLWAFAKAEQPAPLLFAAAADAAAANLGECAPTVIASVVWAFAKAAQPAAALYAAVAAEAERRLPEFDASQRASMAVSFAAAGHADLAAGFRPAEAEGGEAAAPAAMEVAENAQLAEEEAAVAAAVAETALGESDA